MSDDKVERGSSKLWDSLTKGKAPDGQKLASMLSAAQGEYKIERWWWYGQPRIDRIKFDVQTPVDQFADFAGSLLKQHGEKVAVTFEVFPIGVVAIDAVRLKVVLEQNVQR